MFIDSINKFIQSVRDNKKTLPHYEKELCDSLTVHFSKSGRESTELMQEDISFIESCFKTRWAKILAAGDYISNPVGVNNLWNKLASDLAPLAGKTASNLLSPLTYGRVLTVISELKTSFKLNTEDQTMCDSIASRCFNQPLDRTVNKADLIHIEGLYKARWLRIFDNKACDYTLDPSGANQKWIAFAKEIAPLTDKTYISILVPTIQNIRNMDYNNLKPLTDTVGLDNFFISHGGNIIYRKRGLCDHLIGVDYLLSICRDLHNKNLSPLTVVELTRIWLCKQTYGVFYLDGEKFNNFWHFLSAKVFPKLQSKGGNLDNIIPEFNHLIKRYTELKTSKSDFNIFKQELLTFIEFLSKEELNNVNYFYGVTANQGKRHLYLLYYLIEMYVATSYDLDNQIDELKTWIGTLTRTWDTGRRNSNGHESSNGSSSGSPGSPSLFGSRPASPTVSSKGKWNREVCSMIASMLSTPFQVNPLTSKKIQLWDLENTVPSELKTMFYSLYPHIMNNNPVLLEQTYQQILGDIPSSSTVINTMFKPKYSRATANGWISQLKDKEIDEWYQPELFFVSLTELNVRDSDNTPKIKDFLDQFIRTYSSRENDLLKALRVNVRFLKLVSELDKKISEKVCKAVMDADFKAAITYYKKNCFNYVAQRLCEKGSPALLSVPQSAEIRRFNSGDFLVDVYDGMEFNSILHIFARKIESDIMQSNPDATELMRTYLNTLRNPPKHLEASNQEYTPREKNDHHGWTN